jgi:hypothetical protein
MSEKAGRLLDRTLDTLAARTLPLYVGLAGAYIAFRAGGFSNIAVRVTDTPTYEEAAAHPLWSVGFLGGTRPLTVPLLYKAVQSDDARIAAQVAISTACWLVLAAVVARSIRHPVVRPLAFATVLAFGLIRELTLWDGILLSESLTLGLLALVLAAWLALVQRPTPVRAAAALVALFFWTFARDSNAYIVLVLGGLIALTLVDARRRRLKLALVAGCAAIFAASFASAEAGQRWLLPAKDVVFRRVLETPDMSRYFAEHGHPVEGNWTLKPWLEQARGLYSGYLVRHPTYTLTAPFHGRQEALYSTADNRTSLLDPDLGLYWVNQGAGFMRPPSVLSRIFFPRGVTVLLALVGGAIALALLVAARRPPPPVVWLVPAAILLTTYPHLLAVWHFSGYEVDRHAFQAALLLRFCVFLLLLLALDHLLVTLRPRRGAPVVAEDPQDDLEDPEPDTRSSHLAPGRFLWRSPI